MLIRFILTSFNFPVAHCALFNCSNQIFITLIYIMQVAIGKNQINLNKGRNIRQSNIQTEIKTKLPLQFCMYAPDYMIGQVGIVLSSTRKKKGKLIINLIADNICINIIAENKIFKQTSCRSADAAVIPYQKGQKYNLGRRKKKCYLNTLLSLFYLVLEEKKSKMILNDTLCLKFLYNILNVLCT